MMELPLVEEIREARRLAEESRDATIHLQRVNAALTNLSVLEKQLLASPDTAIDELPGEEVLDELAERWSQLGDLRASDLHPNAAVSARMQARTLQLQAAWGELKPLMDTSEYRAHHLGHLQEDQRKLLEDPRYEEARVELSTIGLEREKYARDLGPVRQRLSMVAPAHNVVGAFSQRIQSEIELLRTLKNPTRIAIWRSLTVTIAMLTALDEAMRGLGLEFPFPNPPLLPATPAEIDVDSDKIMLDLCRVQAEVGTLLDSLDAQRLILVHDEEQVTGRLDLLTKQLLDRMG